MSALGLDIEAAVSLFALATAGSSSSGTFFVPNCSTTRSRSRSSTSKSGPLPRNTDGSASYPYASGCSGRRTFACSSDPGVCAVPCRQPVDSARDSAIHDERAGIGQRHQNPTIVDEALELAHALETHATRDVGRRIRIAVARILRGLRVCKRSVLGIDAMDDARKSAPDSREQDLIEALRRPPFSNRHR
jgi:hypothetical protein